MEEIQNLDSHIFTQINQSYSHPLLDEVMPVLTDLHNFPLFWLLILSILAFTVFRGGKRAAIVIVGGLIAAGITDSTSHYLLKANFQRSRPYKNPEVQASLRTHPHSGYSFPSNHSGNNFCLATYFSSFYPPAALVLFPVAAVVAYSRIYVGVHYPFDILGGAVWGIFWALLISWLVRRQILPRLAPRDPPDVSN